MSFLPLFSCSVPAQTFRCMTGWQQRVYKHEEWVNGPLFSDKAECCNARRSARRWKQNRLKRQLLIFTRKDNNGWWGECLPRPSCAMEAADMMESAHSSLWQPVKKATESKKQDTRASVMIIHGILKIHLSNYRPLFPLWLPTRR